MLVNLNKQVEERTLRVLDALGQEAAVDQQMLAEGRKQIMDGFMWINRAIFRPQRVVLPEDEVPVDPGPQAPPIHIGEVFRVQDESTGNVEMVHDGKGNWLVAQGPNWYRQDEWDAYAAAVEASKPA